MNSSIASRYTDNRGLYGDDVPTANGYHIASRHSIIGSGARSGVV